MLSYVTHLASNGDIVELSKSSYVLRRYSGRDRLSSKTPFAWIEDFVQLRPDKRVVMSSTLTFLFL